MAKRKINSLELPEDSTYILTKKKAVNPNSFFIVEGQSVEGTLTSNPIRVGESCSVQGSRMSDAIFTSMVKEIKLKKNSKIVTIITENSVYELEEI